MPSFIISGYVRQILGKSGPFWPHPMPPPLVSVSSPTKDPSWIRLMRYYLVIYWYFLAYHKSDHSYDWNVEMYSQFCLHSSALSEGSRDFRASTYFSVCFPKLFLKENMWIWLVLLFGFDWRVIFLRPLDIQIYQFFRMKTLIF